ncbi:NBR1-Ig-like domain-containing protein [Candidatus Kuenenia sp.]|uniref:NBR1-Ig-like domain-containing protein n=1 Tax=Candidatus Kuenenia sp. TaxID=2499824 RepID=UPI003220120E
MAKVAAVVFLALLIPVTASAQSPDSAGSSTRNASSFVSERTIPSEMPYGRVYTGGGADFVSDVTIPDGTVMSTGQSFTKTWKIRNSGPTSWTGYSLAFVGGNQMGAPDFVSVPVTPPGATVDISVPMTAPKDAGSHLGNWQMRTANGEFFGEEVFVLIQVTSSTYEGRALEDWEADLQAHSPAIREKALEALSRFGPRATSALIKTFQSDPDEKVRAMALGALADINPPSNDAVRVLLAAATDPTPSVSTIAAMIIQEALPSRIGPETVTVLVEAMHDANAIRRQLAIQLLAHLGPTAKEAASTLRELADHDPEPRVRNVANEALKLIERLGVVSEDKYSSPRNWFSVQVPKSSNWANVPFSIMDTSVNQPKGNNYDLVTFEVKDFGEVLIASVRDIPDDVLDKMKRDNKRTILSNLANKALSDWRDFPIKSKVVDETYVSTPHGKSLLRVYKAEKASLLVRASGHRPTASDTFDTLIAVIVAKQKNHYIYAIAENDAESNGADKNKDALKRTVQSFFASVDVHR